LERGLEVRNYLEGGRGKEGRKFISVPLLIVPFQLGQQIGSPSSSPVEMTISPESAKPHKPNSTRLQGGRRFLRVPKTRSWITGFIQDFPSD